ncbi:MAG: GlmU family protein [Chitinophagaceae bacterium]|nr:GlmU family protein [Chitinophagaceae bacterium]
MNFVLFDSQSRNNLLPFTHTRPVADIRCGILTMRERWEKLLGVNTWTLTQPYLQPAFPNIDSSEKTYINAAVFATTDLVNAITGLKAGDTLYANDILIAWRPNESVNEQDFLKEAANCAAKTQYAESVMVLNNNWDIFSLNDRAIRADFEVLTKGRKSVPVPQGVTVAGGESLFIEEGANIHPGCIINASTGPVYIGADAEVLEGTIMRGPIALCEHSVVKMGAKIYGATTIGPGCKVGGEINNAVFFANSNKAHDGYLGNAVIGEWCNLGADTNCSNLKNDYGTVKVWHEATGKEINSGLTFCGLMMGDHSKCGINTMFNTGTVVGVSCNIFGSGFPKKFIPSFSWGGADGFTEYRFDKAIEAANRMMGRRGKALSRAEIDALLFVYENYI